MGNSSWGGIPVSSLSSPSICNPDLCTFYFLHVVLVVKLVKPTCIILSMIVERMVSIIAPPGRNFGVVALACKFYVVVVVTPFPP